MGLCKCRVVTSLFCYQHRQPVCDKCMTQDHRTCVVKSYLQWLRDSDFDPNCPICNKSMEPENTIRLSCYDVFHVECLDKFCSSLPEHTAPAGYLCPACNHGIIPPENASSLIIDELKSFLSTRPWAQPPKPIQIPLSTQDITLKPVLESERNFQPKELASNSIKEIREFKETKDKEIKENPSSFRSTQNQQTLGVSSRKTPQTYVTIEDADEDKYKHKVGPVQRVFWSTFGRVSASGKKEIHKPKLILAMIVLLLIIMIFFFFSETPRATEEDTDMFSNI